MSKNTELESLYSNILILDDELRSQEFEYSCTGVAGQHIRSLVDLNIHFEKNGFPSVRSIIKQICQKDISRFAKYVALNAFMSDLDKVAIDLGYLEAEEK